MCYINKKYKWQLPFMVTMHMLYFDLLKPNFGYSFINTQRRDLQKEAFKNL